MRKQCMRGSHLAVCLEKMAVPGRRGGVPRVGLIPKGERLLPRAGRKGSRHDGHLNWLLLEARATHGVEALGA